MYYVTYNTLRIIYVQYEDIMSIAVMSIRRCTTESDVS